MCEGGREEVRGREKGGAREGERTCEGGREEVRGREKGGCRGLASGASLVDDAIECKTRKKKVTKLFRVPARPCTLSRTRKSRAQTPSGGCPVERAGGF